MEINRPEGVYMKRSKTPHFLLLILILLVSLFLSVELSPFQVCRSSVFTSANTTDYRLYVVMNTLLPADLKKTAAQVVAFHEKINGSRPDAFYEIRLYRTRIHYQLHIEYDVVYCDGSGKLI